MLRLLNTVSYAAMTLPFIMGQEQEFYQSQNYQKMLTHQRKVATMAVISQTMRSGKQLPMFTFHHRIRPQILAEEGKIKL
jgi:hypothetical protein